MRIKNVVRNSFFSIFSQILLILVGFFCQRVMNLQMGEELVGMNSVISNIIALLSVTELGISVAVVYHLYRAVDAKDENGIAGLMNFYRKAYYIFAIVVGTLGLIILPFVHIFLRENTFSLGYIRTIYLLWLFRTIVSYLTTYKRSILIADQKEYIVSIFNLLANILNYICTILIVEYTQNYILALSLNIVIELCINLWINHQVHKRYPFLRRLRKISLDKTRGRTLFQDVKNIFVTRLSAKLLLSTDSLIMSSFINVAIVGLYANYTMITQSLTNIVVTFSNTLQPTVGNMFIEEDHKKEYGVLRQITFLFFLFASFASVSLFALMTPFVSDIWLGDKYALGFEIIIWCVINFFVNTMCAPLNMMMGVTGLFDKERNISIIAAGVNIILSLGLVIPFGIPGVLFGTFVAYLIQFVYRMIVLICKYMKENCRIFILDMLQYMVLTLGEVALVLLCKEYIYVRNSLWSFIVLACVCVVIPNGLNLLFFRKSWRLQSIIGMLKGILLKQKN